MSRHPSSGPRRSPRVLRVTASLATLVLLPPFVALAVAPMLLLLVPVAILGIPFIVPAMISGSLAARSEDRARASWRPPEPNLANLRLVSAHSRTKG